MKQVVNNQVQKLTSTVNSLVSKMASTRLTAPKYHAPESTYFETLMFPELAAEGRVSGRNDDTFTYKTVIPYNLAVNASGNATFFYSPQAVGDSLSGITGFGWANNATLDGSTQQTTNGFTGQRFASVLGLTPDVFKAYRVVGSSLVITSPQSLTSSQGEMVVGLSKVMMPVTNHTQTSNITAANLLPFTVFANIDSLKHRKVAFSAHMEQSRAIWLPIDDTDQKEYLDINFSKAASVGNQVETSIIVGYCANFAPNSTVRVEIHIDLEFPIEANTFLSSQGHLPVDRTDPSDVVARIKLEYPDSIVTASKTTDEDMHRFHSSIRSNPVLQPKVLTSSTSYNSRSGVPLKQGLGGTIWATK